MKVFTTGQVAKICKVSQRTARKWFDSGRLKGYRIPGSQDRRVPGKYLVKFLKEHGMSLGELEEDAMAKVLVISQDKELVGGLKAFLTREKSFSLVLVGEFFEGGTQVGKFNPHCVIVDFEIDWAKASIFCSDLRGSRFGDVGLVAIMPKDSSSTPNMDANETYRKPVDMGLLEKRLVAIIQAVNA